MESDHAGAAFFDADGLHGLHGGDLAGVLNTARRALGPGARFGAAPSRFASHAAALQVRPRKGRYSHVVTGAAVRDFLAPLPVALLRTRPELQALPDVLERLGIRTLGELAALPSRAVAERFGHPGLLALDLSRGRDTPLEPRRPFEPVVERLDLPEAASGQQLERALELLIARVLARRERRGARCARWPCPPASWPAAPGARRSRCGTRAPTPPGSGSRLPRAHRAARAIRIPGARGRGLRPARPGPGPPAGRGRRGTPRAARRGRPPGAPGGRGGCRPAGARRGSGLAASPSAARCSRRFRTRRDAGWPPRAPTRRPAAHRGRPGDGGARPSVAGQGGRFGPRGVGGRGPLVDRETAPQALLRARARSMGETSWCSGTWWAAAGSCSVPEPTPCNLRLLETSGIWKYADTKSRCIAPAHLAL